MKRAIYIPLIVGACGLVVACGSGPGSDSGTRGQSFQDPPANPNPPPSNSNAPPDDPNAPPDNPNQPPGNPNQPPIPGGQVNGPGGGVVETPSVGRRCDDLCDAAGDDCRNSCNGYCADVRAGRVNCAGQVSALLACAEAIGLICNGDQAQPSDGTSCQNEYLALFSCVHPQTPGQQ